MTWIHWKEEQTTTNSHNKGSAKTLSNQNSTNENPLRHVLTPSNKSTNLYRNNIMTSTPSPWQCLHYIRVASKWVITIGKCVHNSLCALPTHIEHDYIPKICEGCIFPHYHTMGKHVHDQFIHLHNFPSTVFQIGTNKAIFLPTTHHRLGPPNVAPT